MEDIYDLGFDLGGELDKTVITVLESRLNKPASTVYIYPCNPTPTGYFEELFRRIREKK